MRLRETEAWLAHVLAQTLAAQTLSSPMKWPLRVVDATVINGPGPVAAQWRAHVLVDPATGGFRAVEPTGNEGGEKLSRHPVRAGEVILGDRAYATARGVHAVREAEAHVLVHRCANADAPAAAARNQCLSWKASPSPSTSLTVPPAPIPARRWAGSPPPRPGPAS